MAEGDGHVVRREAVHGEILTGGKEVAEKVEWSFACLRQTSLEAVEADLPVAETDGVRGRVALGYAREIGGVL